MKLIDKINEIIKISKKDNIDKVIDELIKNGIIDKRYNGKRDQIKFIIKKYM